MLTETGCVYIDTRHLIDTAAAFDHITIVYRSRLRPGHPAFASMQAVFRGGPVWVRASLRRYGKGFGLELLPLPADSEYAASCLWCLLRRIQRTALYYNAAVRVAEPMHSSNMLVGAY